MSSETDNTRIPKERVLTNNGAYRLLKEAGAVKVSAEAIEELQFEAMVMLDKMLRPIANNAVKMAKHAGRQTVRATDVKLARAISS